MSIQALLLLLLFNLNFNGWELGLSLHVSLAYFRRNKTTNSVFPLFLVHSNKSLKKLDSGCFSDSYSNVAIVISVVISECIIIVLKN